MPKKLALTLACGDYEIVRPLLNDNVEVDGVNLTILTDMDSATRHWRFLNSGEFDIAELSSSSYLAARDNDMPFRAIPVFPSRVFRQSSFYVAPRAGIAGPSDLAGRRVGIPEWAQTAGIYARAYLQHQCGVLLRDIHWVQAGVNEPGRIEKVKLSLPSGVAIERVSDRSLNDMLLAGDLDAIISAREPNAFVTHDPRIVRLWPGYRVLEEAYYRETGVFPIMHAIVIKAETLDRHPWIAMNLFKAFEEAKTNSLRNILRSATSRIPIAWSHHAALEAQKVFGDDCWPYGIEPNRRTLEAFLQYCYEQGVTNREVRIEELFPRELGKFFKT